MQLPARQRSEGSGTRPADTRCLRDQASPEKARGEPPPPLLPLLGPAEPRSPLPAGGEAGRRPGTGGGRLPPGLGDGRPRGGHSRVRGRPPRLRRWGGGGGFFWGGVGRGGGGRTGTVASASSSAAARAAGSRRQQLLLLLLRGGSPGAEGCGVLGEAGSSGSSPLPSWWPWCVAPRGRSRRAEPGTALMALPPSPLPNLPLPPPSLSPPQCERSRQYVLREGNGG